MLKNLSPEKILQPLLNLIRLIFRLIVKIVKSAKTMVSRTLKFAGLYPRRGSTKASQRPIRSLHNLTPEARRIYADLQKTLDQIHKQPR